MSERERDEAEAVPLVAYRLFEDPPEIRPAPSQRSWMDQTPKRYAYRCLPMVIANMHGWELCSCVSFTAIWRGGPAKDELDIIVHEGRVAAVSSHFGSGILTFQAGYLFRTPPGFNLYVKGPANRPKPHISPLEGVVETDWSSAPFTMNWQLTRPETPITFQRGEPFCTIFPLRRHALEAVTPEIRKIETSPDELAAYHAWRASRADFLTGLRSDEPSDAKEQGWQRDYFRGTRPDGEQAEHHQTKLSLAEFERSDEEE